MKAPPGIAAALLVLLLAGLAPPAAGASGTEGTMLGIKDLPCFKCHIYDRFLQEPAPGVFSHVLHVQFEYHCNQCHSFRGHRRMVIHTDLCRGCHGSVPELKRP